MSETSPPTVRLQVAEVLEAIANESSWNDELWQRFNDLMKRVEVDDLLAHADEELVHYSGVFNARNLFGFRVKPDKSQIADYTEQFRLITAAIRNGTSWEEYKRQNRIFESGELSRAIIEWTSRLFRG